MKEKKKTTDSDESDAENPLDGAGDARLVEEVRRGNVDAFGDLVNRYEARVLRVIRRFVTDQEQSRDLAQEAFMRSFRRLDQFDPSRRFGPWLFRIAVNLTLDYLRKKKRQGRWSLFSESSAERLPDPPSEDPRLQADLSQEVRAVLDQIPEKYRTVLVLRDLENFSTSEIAAITDRKEATIRWRLAEARHRFKDIWEKRLQQDAERSSE
ncbi:MAG: RNA polymerase sigma factor [Planctomycetaceae bacterium]